MNATTNSPKHNIRLTAEQLDVLRAYIRKRGFTDEMVIHEILDHFACKTEEIWTEEPRLSLEAAMLKAHESFGIMGFSPIANSFSKNMQRQYMQWYKRQVLRICTSLTWMPACLLSGWLVYLFLRHAPALPVLGDYQNTYAIMLVLLILLVEKVLLIKYSLKNYHYSSYPLLRSSVVIMGGNWEISVFLTFLFISQAKELSLGVIWCLVVLSIIHQIIILAGYFTFEKAKENARIAGYID